MEIEIRDATGEDADGVREVGATTWLTTYPNEEAGITRQDIKEAISRTEQQLAESRERWKVINTNPYGHTFVAIDENRVIGFCTAFRGKKDNRIQSLYVLPEYQGKKVGARLMLAGLEWIGQGKDIYVNVASYNSNAIEFYKKFGFVEVRRGVFDDAARLPSGKVIPEIEMVKKGSE